MVPPKKKTKKNYKAIAHAKRESSQPHYHEVKYIKNLIIFLKA